MINCFHVLITPRHYCCLSQEGQHWQRPDATPQRVCVRICSNCPVLHWTKWVTIWDMMNVRELFLLQDSGVISGCLVETFEGNTVMLLLSIWECYLEVLFNCEFFSARPSWWCCGLDRGHCNIVNCSECIYEESSSLSNWALIRNERHGLLRNKIGSDHNR